MVRSALVIIVASAAASAAFAQGTPSPAAVPFADGRLTLSAEALLFWFKGSPTPVAIVTDDYANSPDVNVLLGGGTVDTNPSPGFKVTGA